MCLWLHVRSLDSPGDEAKYVLSIFWCWSVWWMVVDTSEEKILLISLFYFRLIQKTQRATKMTQFGQRFRFIWTFLQLSYSWTSIIAPSKIAFTSKIASISEWPTFYSVKYLQKLRQIKISWPRKLRRTFHVKIMFFWPNFGQKMIEIYQI